MDWHRQRSTVKAMIRRHITPSLLISLLALFIATSGTSYAVLQIPKKSVGTTQLKTSAVTSKKVKDGSLRAKDFKAGSLPSGPIGPVGPVGPVGPQGPQGPAAANATVPAYRTDGSAPLVLTSSFQPVITLNLPAGDYVVWSRANLLENGSRSGQVICSLGNDAAQNVSVDQGKLVAISQTTTLTLASPGSIQLFCLRQNTPAPAPNVTVQQRSITAIKVSSITES